MAIFVSFESLEAMVNKWEAQEEYSYGYMIPVITLFLMWQRKDKLEQIEFTGSWAGVVVVVGGLLLYMVGTIATLHVVVQYAFIMMLIGALYTLTGREAFRQTLVPMLFLVFMVPLPAFLFNNLSAYLQLISSEIGVAVIRLFGISVYLEGNVIDLGSYKLQVVEACSGLRYLFPLVTLSFITAYFFKEALWKRAIIFLSSVPITIFMNSFRIGVIGVLVEYGGPGQAEGFLHDFEGWIVFMACISILIGEMWIFTKLSKGSRPLMEVFGLEFPEPATGDLDIKTRVLPKSFIATLVVMLVVAIASPMIDDREEIIPDRTVFTELPLDIGEWNGREDRIEKIYLDALKLDDYVITDYVNNDGSSVNFYSAYYASQKSGESAHSPRSCIPGAGWQIKDHSVIVADGINDNGQPFHVNRMVVRKGEYAQVVYYWFQQRGRNITNEYLVKWYLFWDGLTRNRTDGALVRFTTVLKPGEDLHKADNRIMGLLKEVHPLLGRFIPE
jgi:exosortase D (VPLPA-CTERM-specific)